MFTGDEMRKNLQVDDSFGFNLQHFNSVVSKKRVIARKDLNMAMLSDSIDAFSFDFQNDHFFPAESKTIDIPVTASGRCYGVIQWIYLQMDQEVTFENHPCEKTSVANWQQCAYLFDEPLELQAGQVVVISALHDRKVPWFFPGASQKRQQLDRPRTGPETYYPANFFSALTSNCGSKGLTSQAVDSRRTTFGLFRIVRFRGQHDNGRGFVLGQGTQRFHHCQSHPYGAYSGRSVRCRRCLPWLWSTHPGHLPLR